MSKSLLVSNVAAAAGITNAQAQAAVEAVIDTFKTAASKKEKLTITGFLTMNVRHKPAHKGRNVATGAEIDIPAKDVVSFKPGSALKEAANS